MAQRQSQEDDGEYEHTFLRNVSHYIIGEITYIKGGQFDGKKGRVTTLQPPHIGVKFKEPGTDKWGDKLHYLELKHCLVRRPDYWSTGSTLRDYSLHEEVRVKESPEGAFRKGEIIAIHPPYLGVQFDDTPLPQPVHLRPISQCYVRRPFVDPFLLE